MHMFSKENNFYGGHGIVGAQVPIGTGIAFTHKYNGEKNICRTYIGDGAMNNGQVFEAFNLAALWKLPVLYIIENNKYGMGTSVNRSAAGNELYERATVFGIKGEKVNGMDFFDVSQAAIRARDHIYEHSKPYVIEMDTYRYRGHSMSDPANYRSKDEVNKMKSHDPVFLMRNAFMSIPTSLREVALLEGSSELRIMLSVMLPLAIPGLLTLMVFALYGSWNDFILAFLFVNSTDMEMLNIFLMKIALGGSQFDTFWGLLNAGAIISFLPIILFYIFLQQYFVRGVTGSAVKE